ncbi:MAG: hypothetical protein ACUVXG_06485 [Anaerolineae bacterium]
MTHPLPSIDHASSVTWDWLLVLLLVSFAVAPLTYPGFLQAWSGFAPVYALEDGMQGRPLAFWGVGWFPGAAEGSLPYLVARLPASLGASSQTAIRWVWATGFALGALGIYAWLRGRWGRSAALLAAVTYTYAPYHLNAVYARGAVGEALALGLLPWLPWALERRGWKGVVGLGTGLLALLATVPALAALAAMPLAGVAGLRLRGKVRWAAWTVLLAGAAWGAWAWAAQGRYVPAPLYSLLAGLASLANPWSLGMVPLATLLGVGGLLLWRQLPQAREAWPWLAAFVLGCLTATVWPGGDGFRWSPLSLTVLSLPPLMAMFVADWPALRRLEAVAGVAALAVLAASPLLTPAFTRLDLGPQPLAVWEVAGGTRLALLEAEVMGSPADPAGIGLELQWQAWGDLHADYTVFVHLVDGSGKIVAQRDGQPREGQRPTSGWRSGEIVADAYTLHVNEGMAAGPFRIALGWYRGQPDERLPLVRASLPAEPDHRVWVHVP